MDSIRHGNVRRSHADAVRAWEYPYDQWCRAFVGLAMHAVSSPTCLHRFCPVRAVDCPRASCDLGMKLLMLWSHVWDPRVCPGSKDLGSHMWLCVRNHPPAFSRFSVCSCNFWPSIGPAQVPHGFRKVSLQMQCGPVQTPYGLWNNLLPVLQTVCDKYRASRTHKYGCRLDHEWHSAGSKASVAHLWKLYMLIFQPRPIRRLRTRPPIIEKSYKPAAQSSAQSDQGFRYALNWQTRTQSFFIRTAESNQTELGAHDISVLYN